MNGSRVSRRSVIGAGFGGAAFGVLGGLPAWAQSDVRLRMFWWGSKERADRTDKVNKLYQQGNAGLTITGKSLGWTDYWPRLATQTAGRNAADVLQMDYRYIFEYARRGALLPLDDYLSKSLDLKDFNKATIDSGKVDGKIYGVSLGLNSTSLVYDKEFIQSLGLKPPTWQMTWKEIGDLARRDHQGREARSLYRNGGRRPERAGVRSLARHNAASRSITRKANSASTTRTPANGSPSGTSCASAAAAPRRIPRRSIAARSMRTC